VPRNAPRQLTCAHRHGATVEAPVCARVCVRVCTNPCVCVCVCLFVCEPADRHTAMCEMFAEVELVLQSDVYGASPPYLITQTPDYNQAHMAPCVCVCARIIRVCADARKRPPHSTAIQKQEYSVCVCVGGGAQRERERDRDTERFYRAGFHWFGVCVCVRSPPPPSWAATPGGGRGEWVKKANK
jgi:hypothetical protein